MLLAGNPAVRPQRAASERSMAPEHDEMVATSQETEKREHWYQPIRCSICTCLIWFRAIVLREPAEVPEPRQEWILCKACHKALLVEMSRSPIRSPMRLRIAIGLVAAEHSPQLSPEVREQQQFQRELSLAIWFMIFLAFTHVIIFVILIGIPK